jgi:hypothetical protein
MKARRSIRTQKVEITMAAGVADGTLTEANIQFDRKYERAIGVAAVEKTASAVFFELGIQSPRGAEMDLAASSLLISDSSVAPNLKYKEIDIPVVDGELVNVQLKNSSGAVVPAGGITVQFVFVLLRDEVDQTQ